ncbi:DNA primase family protein [Haloferax mediterranei]|nr:phage/plasmid primase, P4 family [Haloferax mediterranei]
MVKLAENLQSVVSMWKSRDYDTGETQSKVAQFLDWQFSFAHPRENVDGMRPTLHVYNPDTGMYEPNGKEFVGEMLQEIIPDWLNKTRLGEIRAHLKRANYVSEDDIGGNKHEVLGTTKIVNWETGQARDFSPDDIFLTRVEMPWYGLDEEATEWEEFISDLVPESDVSTMFHFLAHAMVDAYPDEKGFVFANDGGGGKSTFFEATEGAIGDDNVSNETLRALSSTSDQYSEAELYGKRLNISPELPAERLSSMEMFKRLTGGDRISARFPYEGKFQFRNAATQAIVTNHIPDIAEDKDAIWRRLVLITFPNNFEDGEMADKRRSKADIMNELHSDDALAGLFARLVRHTMQATEEDGEWFPDIKPMWERREQLKKGADPMFSWAKACLVENSEGRVTLDEAQESFRRYANQEGLSPGIEARDKNEARQKFGTKLLGYKDFDIESDRKRINGKKTRVYEGVALSARGLESLTKDRPGEKILSSIESQARDEDDEPADSDESDLDAGKRCGAEVVVTSTINRLNDKNSSAAEYRAIIEHCKEHHKLSVEIVDAIGSLEERGAIVEDEDGVYRVVDDVDEDSGDDENDDGDSGAVSDEERRTVVCAVRDAQSHEYDSVQKSSVAGRLSRNGSDMNLKRLEAVLEDLDSDGYVVLGEGQAGFGETIALVDTAFDLLEGVDA